MAVRFVFSTLIFITLFAHDVFRPLSFAFSLNALAFLIGKRLRAIYYTAK